MTRLASFRFYAEAAKLNGSYCVIWPTDLLHLLDMIEDPNDDLPRHEFEENDL